LETIGRRTGKRRLTPVQYVQGGESDDAARSAAQAAFAQRCEDEQIGNAVPIPLAAAIGRQIASLL